MIDTISKCDTKYVHYNDRDKIWDKTEYFIDNLEVMDYLRCILNLAEKDYNLTDDFLTLLGFLSISSNLTDLSDKLKKVLNRETFDDYYFDHKPYRTSLKVTNLIDTYHSCIISSLSE